MTYSIIMSNKKTVGKFGEKIARKYLEDKGYKILETNYYTRVGEIDLICQKGDTLIFVEVKTRKNTAFGYPEEAIDKKKLEHLAQAVQQFLKDYPCPANSIRIDAICINVISQDKIRIKHLKNIVQDWEINED